MMPPGRGLIEERKTTSSEAAHPIAHGQDRAESPPNGPPNWRGAASLFAITPGFPARNRCVHWVTEDTWREAGRKDPNFLVSRAAVLGRAIAALAADPKVRDRTGLLLSSWELAREYGFTDYDGRRPDWGRHTIDFSVLPPEWIDLFRTGTDLEIQWLTALAARARKFRAKVPHQRCR
jgi:hypothetical protein